jgi:hypothetical protein
LLAVVNTVMKFWISQNAENFLTSWVTISFSCASRYNRPYRHSGRRYPPPPRVVSL